MRSRLYRNCLGWVLAVVAISLVATSQARSTPFGPEEWAAFEYAPTYWGANAPCDSFTGVVLSPSEMVVYDGQDVASGKAQLGPECVIWINSELSGSGLCAVMLHEYGHLLGYTHEDRLISDAPFHEDPGCKAFDIPFERQEAWRYWRQLRAYCFTRVGRVREKCLRTVHRRRQELITQFVSTA